jgi:hypothetical protein
MEVSVEEFCLFLRGAFYLPIDEDELAESFCDRHFFAFFLGMWGGILFLVIFIVYRNLSAESDRFY